MKLFTNLVQLSYLVDDVEAAASGWSQATGIGPWFFAERMEITDYRYRGRPASTAAVSVAMTYVGSVQLELIRPARDAGPTLFDEFIHAARMPAMHHAAFMEPDYDLTYRGAIDRGFVVAHEGDTYRGRLVYFENPALPGAIVELCEATPERVRVYEAMQRICSTWDGTQPIRRAWPD